MSWQITTVLCAWVRKGSAMGAAIRRLAVFGMAGSLILFAGCDNGEEDPVPPVIATQPADQTITEGETATFTVTATGDDLSYQWEQDGVPISGATGASYATPPTSLTDDGTQYTCVITNPGGSAESDPVTLTVLLALTDTYVVADLATGGVTQAAAVADLETNDAYRTTHLVLKRIPAGTFQMGDQTGVGASWELPVHTVNITRAFYTGVFEVTQRQWYEIKGTWPGYFTSSPTSTNETRPVEQVSWNDIEGPGGFMDRLSSLTSMGLRLPTEAEWEYCCKAGTSTDYFCGDTADVAWMWHYQNSGHQTHEVGTRLPNPWGLYDMHGNVSEWCEDRWDSSYYSVSPSDDPQGPARGDSRMQRGGSWYCLAVDCRSAFRHRSRPTYSDYIYGFRVVAAAP